MDQIKAAEELSGGHPKNQVLDLKTIEKMSKKALESRIEWRESKGVRVVAEADHASEMGPYEQPQTSEQLELSQMKQVLASFNPAYVSADDDNPTAIFYTTTDYDNPAATLYAEVDQDHAGGYPKSAYISENDLITMTDAAIEARIAFIRTIEGFANINPDYATLEPPQGSQPRDAERIAELKRLLDTQKKRSAQVRSEPEYAVLQKPGGFSVTHEITEEEANGMSLGKIRERIRWISERAKNEKRSPSYLQAQATNTGDYAQAIHAFKSRELSLLEKAQAKKVLDQNAQPFDANTAIAEGAEYNFTIEQLEKRHAKLQAEIQAAEKANNGYSEPGLGAEQGEIVRLVKAIKALKNPAGYFVSPYSEADDRIPGDFEPNNFGDANQSANALPPEQHQQDGDTSTQARDEHSDTPLGSMASSAPTPNLQHTAITILPVYHKGNNPQTAPIIGSTETNTPPEKSFNYYLQAFLNGVMTWLRIGSHNLLYLLPFISLMSIVVLAMNDWLDESSMQLLTQDDEGNMLAWDAKVVKYNRMAAGLLPGSLGASYYDGNNIKFNPDPLSMGECVDEATKFDALKKYIKIISAALSGVLAPQANTNPIEFCLNATTGFNITHAQSYNPENLHASDADVFDQIMWLGVILPFILLLTTFLLYASSRASESVANVIESPIDALLSLLRALYENCFAPLISKVCGIKSTPRIYDPAIFFAKNPESSRYLFGRNLKPHYVLKLDIESIDQTLAGRFGDASRDAERKAKSRRYRATETIFFDIYGTVSEMLHNQFIIALLRTWNSSKFAILPEPENIIMASQREAKRDLVSRHATDIKAKKLRESRARINPKERNAVFKEALFAYKAILHLGDGAAEALRRRFVSLILTDLNNSPRPKQTQASIIIADVHIPIQPENNADAYQLTLLTQYPVLSAFAGAYAQFDPKNPGYGWRMALGVTYWQRFKNNFNGWGSALDAIAETAKDNEPFRRTCEDLVNSLGKYYLGDNPVPIFGANNNGFSNPLYDDTNNDGVENLRFGSTAPVPTNHLMNAENRGTERDDDHEYAEPNDPNRLITNETYQALDSEDRHRMNVVINTNFFPRTAPTNTSLRTITEETRPLLGNVQASDSQSELYLELGPAEVDGYMDVIPIENAMVFTLSPTAIRLAKKWLREIPDGIASRDESIDYGHFYFKREINSTSKICNNITDTPRKSLEEILEGLAILGNTAVEKEDVKASCYQLAIYLVHLNNLTPLPIDGVTEATVKEIWNAYNEITAAYNSSPRQGDQLADTFRTNYQATIVGLLMQTDQALTALNTSQTAWYQGPGADASANTLRSMLQQIFENVIMNKRIILANQKKALHQRDSKSATALFKSSILGGTPRAPEHRGDGSQTRRTTGEVTFSM